MADAKRHHFVPQLLLRRFSAEPGEKNPPLWRLDTQRGTPSKTWVKSESVIGHYYRIEDPKIPLAPGHAEATLSRIESEAAVAIRKLVEGTALTEVERQWMAFFLHVQRQRTPEGRAWHASLAERTMIEDMKVKLSSAEFVRSRFSDKGDSSSETEVERWRVKMLAGLEDGTIRLEPSQNREVALIFLAADKIVPGISYATTWRSLRAPAGTGFICSDNPLNIYDPEAPSREPMHQGVGWVSSRAVEATLPLDPRVCLLVTPGPARWRVEDVDAERVAEINLRTYAAAHQFIYGPTQNSVQQVRLDAKHNRSLVAEFRPRPPQITIIESVKGETKPRKVTTYRAVPPAAVAHQRQN